MKQVNALIIIFFSFFCFEILIQSQKIINVTRFSLSIWKNNIFPSLFPFFVLSDLMIGYGIPDFIGNLIKPIMNKLFKIKGSTGFIFIMGLISGNPSSAKCTRELYLLGKLNKYEATKIICFSSFANPLFILGTVATMFLKSPNTGLFMLFCHYIGNLFVGFFLRSYHPSTFDDDNISFDMANKQMYKKRINNSFGKIFTNSLVSSINTLLMILGSITMCLVLTTIIDSNIHLNSINQSVLNGFIEMTQGLKYISMESLPLKIKCILSIMILSFGGLSIHIQIISILSDTEIKYLPFLGSRIMHATISSILAFFLFDFFF